MNEQKPGIEEIVAVQVLPLVGRGPGAEAVGGDRIDAAVQVLTGANPMVVSVPETEQAQVSSVVSTAQAPTTSLRDAACTSTEQ